MARPTKYPVHKEQALLQVHHAMERHASPPTVRAMAEELGVGVATMHSYLSKLAEEGLVEWKPKSHRSLRLTPLALQLLSLRGAPQP